MINKERSYTEYNVEVPTTDFPIGFDILDDGIDVVAVTLNDVDPTTLGYTVIQVNNTTYRFAPAVPSGVVRLTRITDIDQMAHVFTEGAIFISENMDGNFKQIRHAQQEVRDAFDFLESNTLGVVAAAKDATTTALAAASTANEAAAAVNDKVSYSDLDNAVDTAVAPIKDYVALPYVPLKSYKLYERVQLENGDIVKSTVPNNTANPNIDMTGWRFDGNTVESIADLIAIQNPKGAQVVYVESYHKATNFTLNDPFKGGGNFEFVPARSSENDGVSVFNGWVRLNIGAEIDLYQAGGIDLRDLSGVDNVDAISKVQAYARLTYKVVRVSGWFATSKPVVQISGDVMLGNGFHNSRFYKTTNDSLPLAGRIAPERVGVTDQYNVDAMLIWYADDNSYAGGIETKDIFFQAGSYNDEHPVAYGLYAPRHSACVTENLQFDNVKVAFKANNLFLNRHVNFKSIGSTNGGVNRGETGVIIYDGEDIMTGTSNTFERFLMVNYQRAYDVQNLQTSEFSKCYGEQIAKSAGAETCIVWTFINPWQVTLSNCGQEQTKASAIYVHGNSSYGTKKTLKVVSYQAFWGISGYSTELSDNLITVDGNVIVSFDSSLILKNGAGFLLNGIFRNNGAIVINNGSILGASDNSSFSTTKAIQTTDGFAQKTEDVGVDLNNGVEDAVGMSVKPVYGATLNLPSGLSDAWGVSQYFGANESEGFQIFMSITSDAIYKRRRTGISSFTGWTVL